MTAPNGQQTQVPATVTPDGWISVGAQSYYPGTKFEINGTIRATLTWTGTGTGPDPQQMILQEDSEATYTSTSGAASNGLGDPCIVSSGGGSSQGSAWNVFTNDGVYTIRRRVSVRGEITASSGFGGVWLRYRVTPTPILPVVQGAVWHDNQFKCLPGHKLILSVNTGTYAQTGHNWTPPGTDLVFKAVITEPGNTPEFRSYQSLVSPADTQGQNLAFFVAKPKAESNAKLDGQVITPEGTLGFTANLAWFTCDLKFDIRALATTGTPALIEDELFYTFWSSAGVPAIKLRGGLTEVIPASLFGSNGTWTFSQLIKWTTWRGTTIWNVEPATFSDFRLDNHLVYQIPPQAPTPANNSDREFEDAPAQKVLIGLLQGVSQYTYNMEARLFILYTPPPNGVGGSDVAIFELKWNVDRNFNLDFVNDPGNTVSTNGEFVQGNYSTQSGFQWSKRYVNSF